MLRPVTNITFTKSDGTELSFNFCNSFEINSSFEKLTDTAKIIIPKKLKLDGVDLFAGSNPIFKRGDRVKIQAGYYPNLVDVFDGYIRNVSGKIPIELTCEDKMYLLKSYTVSYPQKLNIRTVGRNGQLLKRPKVTSDNVSLTELLNYIIDDDIEFKAIDDIQLGQFRVKNASPSQVLDKLKTEYGLYSYFVDGVLNVGFPLNAADTNEGLFEMEKVVINADDLVYQIEDEVKVKVKAISIMPDNSKIEVEVGDPEGEQKTIHKYNLNESDLRKVAEAWVGDFKYTGFEGDLETFGEPKMNFGDRCKIVSSKLPERNGVYLIKAVKRTYSVDGGYRQIFTLDKKVA